MGNNITVIKKQIVEIFKEWNNDSEKSPDDYVTRQGQNPDEYAERQAADFLEYYEKQNKK